jgi:hypothetical protein
MPSHLYGLLNHTVDLFGDGFGFSKGPPDYSRRRERAALPNSVCT